MTAARNSTEVGWLRHAIRPKRVRPEWRHAIRLYRPGELTFSGARHLVTRPPDAWSIRTNNIDGMRNKGSRESTHKGASSLRGDLPKRIESTVWCVPILKIVFRIVLNGSNCTQVCVSDPPLSPPARFPGNYWRVPVKYRAKIFDDPRRFTHGLIFFVSSWITPLFCIVFIAYYRRSSLFPLCPES